MSGPVGKRSTSPLSRERHHFGFAIRPLLDVLRDSAHCDGRRCSSRSSVAIIDYGYVREADKRPTYVSETVCDEHADRFCERWGLEREKQG